MIEGVLLLSMLLFTYCILLHAWALGKGRRIRFVSALFIFRQALLSRKQRREERRRA